MSKWQDGEDLRKQNTIFDYSLLFIILFLTGFGLVMIYSASAYDATTQNLNEDYYLMHQAFAAALGLVGMFFVSPSHIIFGSGLR